MEGGDLFLGQPAGGIHDEAAGFQRVMAHGDPDLLAKDWADRAAGEMAGMDLCVLSHQGVLGQQIVMLPAGQGAHAAHGGVHDLQAGAMTPQIMRSR